MSETGCTARCVTGLSFTCYETSFPYSQGFFGEHVQLIWIYHRVKITFYFGVLLYVIFLYNLEPLLVLQSKASCRLTSFWKDRYYYWPFITWILAFSLQWSHVTRLRMTSTVSSCHSMKGEEPHRNPVSSAVGEIPFLWAWQGSQIITSSNWL